MKISFDSNDALQDVIRVVEAAYGVSLQVGEADTEAKAAPKAAPRQRSGRGRKGGRPASKSSAPARRGRRAAKRSVSPSQIREWAREQGHTVSATGRIPAAVVTAYQEAH